MCSSDLMENRKNYDSDDTLVLRNARVMRDVETKTSSRGEWGKVTFLVTSKSDGDEPMWVDANIPDAQFPLLRALRKGDVLTVEGKLTMRRVGEKVYFSLRYTRYHLPISLLLELRARGGDQGDTAPQAGTSPASPSTARKGRPVVELDDLPF